MSWDPPQQPPPYPLAHEDRLLEQRVVMVSGALDDRRVTDVVARLLTLDADSTDEVALYLNCPEGTLDAAFAVHDAVRLMRAPVRTVATGSVGSPPLLVLAGATATRLATPSARLLLRSPRTLADPAGDIESAARQLAAQRERWHELLAAHTGRPLPDLVAEADRGRWFSAAEAAAYGLVDAVA